MKKILAIGAHPDDVELGCGGTLAKMASEGFSVHVLHLSDGVDARVFDALESELRRVAGICAGVALGASSTRYLDLPDQQFDSFNLLHTVKQIENYLQIIQPDVVFTHWEGDLNLDHQITARAVLTACRPVPGSSVEAIYGFEVLSSTEWGTSTFRPVSFVDISGEPMNRKRRALMEYDQEMRQYPHPRSYIGVECQAAMRGMQSGLKQAEAFHIYRQIRR